MLALSCRSLGVITALRIPGDATLQGHCPGSPGCSGYQCLEAKSCQRRLTFQSQPLLTAMETRPREITSTLVAFVHAGGGSRAPASHSWPLPLYQGSCSGLLMPGCPLSGGGTHCLHSCEGAPSQSCHPQNKQDPAMAMTAALGSCEEIEALGQERK